MSKSIPESEKQRIKGSYEAERLERGVEAGKCFCGCGDLTGIHPRSHLSTSVLKGEPKRFIQDHWKRPPGPVYIEEDRGYGTDCWVWQISITGAGYGQIKTSGQAVLAHRAFYQEAYGPISGHLDHLCRVRRCVRPSHLEPATHAVNIQRGSLAKLTPAKVLHIRELYATGRYSQRNLAKVFSVSNTSINRTIRYKSWKNI